MDEIQTLAQAILADPKTLKKLADAIVATDGFQQLHSYYIAEELPVAVNDMLDDIAKLAASQIKQ